MKINHDVTKTQIIGITELLRKQAENATTYRAAKVAVGADEMMSQKYQQDKITALRESYIAHLNDTKAQIIEKLNAILDDELIQESVLECDVPEFANTLAAINAANGVLPIEVMNSIKHNFAGQYQVLLAIRAAFERYEIDLEKCEYTDMYFSSAAMVLPGLINQAETLEQSEVATFASLKQLFRNVIHFGETRGISFTDFEKDFGEGNNEEADEVIARMAMGLPIE